MGERQLTAAPYGHLLTNTAVWSPDSRWILYDNRSAADGSVFDGTRIERVDVETGRIEVLYESRHGARCGVVTASPVDDRAVFILGPERPTADWQYGPARRQGVVVHTDRPGVAENLDARDLVPPFTPGALRGGSHVHTFSGDGRLVSFTYEDALLEMAAATRLDPGGEPRRNPRCVGVSVCDRPVRVPTSHARNHDGSAFSVLVTHLSDAPSPGSDEISRACEEGWIGKQGYLSADGKRRPYALAFQGQVTTSVGGSIMEAFVVDLPADPAGLAEPGQGPLAGTPVGHPVPPRQASQRRLTFTADRRHPGIQGPRHWLRSSPDGGRIALLLRDDAGIVQLFTVSPLGGDPVQITADPWGVASAFSWSEDGGSIAYVADGSIMTIDVATGRSTRLTPKTAAGSEPRPEAVVFSPDGRWIAFMRRVATDGGAHNQVCVVPVRARARLRT